MGDQVMNSTRRRCPVCWCTVYPTRQKNVQRHRDSIGRDVCPMTDQRFRLCEPWRQTRRPGKKLKVAA